MARSNTPQRPGQQRPDPDETPLLVSVPTAARLLGVGTTFCWELVRSGDISSVRLGRRVLIPRWALEEMIRAHERNQAQNAP